MTDSGTRVLSTPFRCTRRSRPSLSQSSWGATRRSSSSARRGSFARARERSRVDHIKSRSKAATRCKADTACSRSYSQQRLLGRWTCASRISTPAFAAEVLSTTIAATRCKTDTACSRSYSQRRLLGDGPARRASRRARVRGRGALNTTRSRPARSAAAGGGLDSPALPGALFLNRCACAKARLARSS